MPSVAGSSLIEPLAALQEATGAGSMAEVLRDALGVYNSLRDMLASGGQKKLALVDRNAGELQELFIPSLMRGAAIVPGARSSMATRKSTAAAAAIGDRGEVRP